MGKIGLGIITCNREDFYHKCYKCVPMDVVDSLITINDGKPYKEGPPRGTYLHHPKNKGVGVSKNEAMKYLLDEGCEHIFLIEDDILITNPAVFQKYIDTAAESGMWHLMFGYHGPANKGQNDKKPLPKAVIDFGKHKVALNHHCVGAFCYYHKGVLNNVGLMDETFKNAWEHVEHSYQIVKAGLLPGYWWWPDVANSYEYLDEQACSEESSTIRWEDDNKTPKKDWQDNIQTGAVHFMSKHGYSPVNVPDLSLEDVKGKLNFIKENYSRHEARSQ